MVGSSSQLPSTMIDDSEQRIGSYSYFTNKEIGSGYSSKVYKGKKKGCSDDFAIKVIELKKYSNSNMEMLSN
jgi:serine/threonine-protein kinase ULK/ATG1